MRDAVGTIYSSRSFLAFQRGAAVLSVALAAALALADGEIGPRGPNTGVQVNVDDDQRNIVGDAANEPSICVDRTRPNRLAIGWRQFNTVASNFREAGYAYSRDAGRTWRFPGTLRPGQFNSDPVLRSDSAGRFYYLSLPPGLNALQLYRSDDGGATWSAPSEFQGGDKAWMAIDDTGGVGDGNIYTYWSRFFGCCESQVFSRRVEGQATFEPPLAFPPLGEAIYGTLAVDRYGILYTIGISTTGNTGVWRVNRSDTARDPDSDVIFHPPMDVNFGGYLRSGTPSINPGGLLGQSHVVIDRSAGDRDGWIYLLASIWLAPAETDRMDVNLLRSTDGGQTWSNIIKVGDNPPEVPAFQWFGTLSVAPNGRLDVIWYDTRVDALPMQPDNSALFYSSSADGADTWTPPVQLSPAFGHRVGFPQQNKLGDYIDMYSDNVGVGIAYAATHNGEQDVWFYRVGDYDCNGNGIGDLQDIAAGLESDLNGNGNPDRCECIGDIDRDLRIGLADLAALLAGFGLCSGAPTFESASDLDANECVDLGDLALLLSGFGPECP